MMSGSDTLVNKNEVTSIGNLIKFELGLNKQTNKINPVLHKYLSSSLPYPEKRQVHFHILNFLLFPGKIFARSTQI